MSEAQKTTDHDKIKSWIEQRGGKPTMVKTDKSSDGGILRVDFQGHEELKEVSWDEFFREFEQNDLAFLYQDKTQEGSDSRFFKFVNR